MQREAIEKLYSVADRVRICRDKRLMQDFDYLQASNNLRFMSTKANSYGGYRGIYDSPYDAFTNYMNILGDFITRVNDRYPLDIDNEELNSLLTTIKNQGDELELKNKEISKLQNMLAQFEKQEAPQAEAATEEAKAEVKGTPAPEKPKVAAKKPAATKKKAPAATKKATTSAVKKAPAKRATVKTATAKPATEEAK